MICFGLGLLTAAVGCAQGDFEAPAEAMAAWMRQNPQDATRLQYFRGVEQDALDRELVASGPLGLPLEARRREQHLDQLRQEREQLARFAPAQRLTADAIRESIALSLRRPRRIFS